MISRSVFQENLLILREYYVNIDAQIRRKVGSVLVLYFPVNIRNG